MYRPGSASTARHIVPAIVRKVRESGFWYRGVVNLDLGGGPYNRMTRKLKAWGVRNLVYDPYNRTARHNSRVLRSLGVRQADTVTISNVLNVIRDPGERYSILQQARHHVRPGGHVFVTVYEGDRKGQGRETRDGWQQNRRLPRYLEEVQAVFPSAYLKAGMIVAPT